jgi:hypothetical protein
MSDAAILAPEIQASEWLNTSAPLSLADLRGSVVAMHAFQMLCPGCVSHGIPQAEKIQRVFGKAGCITIGLHSVFEHHDAMTPVALKAFVHEYRLNFPIAIDRHEAPRTTPLTMRAYEMRGTPTLILIDRKGLVRRHSFGPEDDMLVGAVIATLLAEPAPADDPPVPAAEPPPST